MTRLLQSLTVNSGRRPAVEDSNACSPGRGTLKGGPKCPWWAPGTWKGPQCPLKLHIVTPGHDSAAAVPRAVNSQADDLLSRGSNACSQGRGTFKGGQKCPKVSPRDIQGAASAPLCT